MQRQNLPVVLSGILYKAIWRENLSTCIYQKSLRAFSVGTPFFSACKRIITSTIVADVVISLDLSFYVRYLQISLYRSPTCNTVAQICLVLSSGRG